MLLPELFPELLPEMLPEKLPEQKLPEKLPVTRVTRNFADVVPVHWKGVRFIFKMGKTIPIDQKSGDSHRFRRDN